VGFKREADREILAISQMMGNHTKSSLSKKALFQLS
jgi:hypothetical protein